MDRELIEHLDRRFEEAKQHVDRRFDQVDRRFEETNAYIEARVEEAKRYFGVLAEDLTHKVQLVSVKLKICAAASLLLKNDLA